MTTSAYSYLYLGALLSPKELQVSKGYSPECSRGHSGTIGAAFCPQCGGKITMVEQMDLSPRFLDYAQKVSKDPNSLFSHLRSTWFHNAKAVASSEDRGEERWIFGVQLLSVGPYEKGLSSTSPSELTGKADEIKTVLSELGFGDRPIALYLSTYWSI